MTDGGQAAIDRQIRQRQALESRRSSVLGDRLCNERGEVLDDLQDFWRPPYSANDTLCNILDQHAKGRDQERKSRDALLALTSVADDVDAGLFADANRGAALFLRSRSRRTESLAQEAALAAAAVAADTNPVADQGLPVLRPLLSSSTGAVIHAVGFTHHAPDFVTGDSAADLRHWRFTAKSAAAKTNAAAKPCAGGGRPWRSCALPRAHGGAITSLVVIEAGEVGGSQVMLTAARDLSLRAWVLQCDHDATKGQEAARSELRPASGSCRVAGTGASTGAHLAQPPVTTGGGGIGARWGRWRLTTRGG